MTEQRRYDVDWTDEYKPRIVIAQPNDEYAMTYTEAEQAIRDGLGELAEANRARRAADRDDEE
ncbi:hypothetical protein [Streptomyces olivaceoviridis]|uniref:hypothetical protein n=1 Tax=Streptomyces olivaceoviridis TaxID=1921 RepID=UPI0036C9A947